MRLRGKGVKLLLLLCIMGVTAALMLPSGSVRAQDASESQVPLPKAFGVPRSVRVSPALGAVSEYIPIVVPPGRRNVEPHLALTYSSMAGLGDAGLGWQLEIGRVECWRGDGTPTVGDPDAFMYSLSGAGGELRNAGDDVYRARLESVYREFHKLVDGNGAHTGWEMSNGEGVLHRFGGTPQSRIDGQLWMLDLVQDQSGNTITYFYEKVNGALYPTEIRYTGFASTGDLGASRVEFEYEGRPDVRVSYGYSVREERRRRLSRISVFAGGSLTRRYEFNYEQSMLNGQSLLSSITLVGADDESRITLRTFEYGSRILGWSDPLENTVPVKFADSKGRDTGTRVSDVNGDGFADILDNGVKVYLGDGTGHFTEDSSWSTSLESANVTFVAPPDGDHPGVDKGVRLVDINGDMRPDLFIAQSDRREVWLNTGSGWSTNTAWGDSLGVLRGYAVLDPSYKDVENPPEEWYKFESADIEEEIESFAEKLKQSDPVSQFLWGQFSDTTKNLLDEFLESTDRDPLKEGLINALVSELNYIIKGGSSIYTEERFKDVELSDVTEELIGQAPNGGRLCLLNRLLLEDAYPDEITRADRPKPNLSVHEEDYSAESLAIVEEDGDSKGVELADVNGDGLMDILWSVDRGDFLYWRDERIPIQLRAVFLNTGAGWERNDELTDALVPFSFVQDSQLQGYSVMDVNGDGLADMMRTLDEDDKLREVCLGTGDGWDNDEEGYSASLRSSGIVSLNADRESQGLNPVDFNDDGLVDYLLANDSLKIAYQNTGTGWIESSQMTQILSNLGIQFVTSSDDKKYPIAMKGVVLADLDGDGISDILEAREPEEDGTNGTNRLWLSSSLRAGLLVQATSALGEVTKIEWACSTGFDNQRSDGVEGLPIPMPLITVITREDGRGNAFKTTFDYGGGLFEDRQFRGFRWSNQWLHSGLRVMTLYHQEEGLAGQLEVEEGYDAEDRVRTRRSSEYNTVEATPVVGSSDMVKQFQLIQNNQETIDPGGTRHMRVENSYDERLNIVWVFRDPDIDVAGDETTTAFSWLRNDAEGVWSLPTRINTLGPDGSPMADFITVYDGRHRPIQTRDLVEPGTYVSRFMEYDQYGNVIRVTDRAGNITHFEYGDPTATYRTRGIDPEGREVRSDYDPRFGKLRRDVDANGNVTLKEYDAFGRLLWVQLPGDEHSPFGTQTYTYSPLGDSEAQYYRVAETETPGQPGTLDTTSFFDGMGLVYRIEQDGADGRNVVTLTEFDDSGNPVATSRRFFEGDDPLFSLIQRDELHRPIRVEEPDGIPLTLSYAGPRVDVINRRGQQTSFYRNGDGKVTEIHQWVDGVEQVTRYQYDAMGRLTVIIDALGEETHISYDALGRRVRLDDPNAGIYNYCYDGEDRLVEQTAPDGQITRFRYNSAGDLVRKEFPDGTVQVFTYGTSRWHNAVGRIVRIEDAAGVLDMKYDVRGRVIERRRTVLGSTYVTGYTYDSLDRIRHITYPDGFAVDYEYDSGGNLAQVKDGQGQVIAEVTDYNAAGQLGKVGFGNGVRSGFGYDQLLRMTSIRTLSAANEVLQSLDYTYDPDGNILSITDGAFGASQTFEYDAISRLTNAIGPYGEESYEYDAIGNLLRKGSLVFTVDPNHPQRVISGIDTEPGGGKAKGIENNPKVGKGVESNPNVARSFQMAYDERGNAVEKDGRYFEYDSENHLLRVCNAVGKVLEENVYDAGGQRVIQSTPQGTTIFIDGIYEEGKTHASRHVYSGPLLVATIMTPSATVQLIQDVPPVTLGTQQRRTMPWNSILATLVCFAGFAIGLVSFRKQLSRRGLAGLAYIGGAMRRRPWTAIALSLLLILSILNIVAQPLYAAMLPPPPYEKRYYYHSNHLGSVNAVTDERGEVIERREYKPYGDQFEWTGPKSGPREMLLTFNGHRYDDVTGLYYFGARHYDAELGRFLTADTQVPDPMDPKSLNRYAFGGGNPIRYSDPTGHGFLDFLLGAVIVVAAVAVGIALIVATVATGGTALIIAGIILGSAFIGAGALGTVALAQGITPLSGGSSFWTAMATGFVLGAIVGAGLATLPWSLTAPALTGAAIFKFILASAMLGAMFGGVEATVVHFVRGGGPESLMRDLLISAGIGAAVSMVFAGAYFKGGLLTEKSLISALRFAAAKAGTRLGIETLVGFFKGYVVGGIITLIFFREFPAAIDLAIYRASPPKSVGVPAWAFSGTWPGIMGGPGTSQEAAVLQTMPLAP